MTKPLQCEITIDQPLDRLYKTLLEQQLLYFRHFDASIADLNVGTTIRRDFYTKIRAHAIGGQTRVTEIKENDCFGLESSYGANHIVQLFTFTAVGDRQTKVAYSETSVFEKASHQTNYGLVSWFYTFFFKRQTKKRLKQLGALACQ